ncbi:hypothetical protein [Lentilactobacillus parafarraginis]|nr:hypothetical protein [Lentilactobacillus parafarraginis]
MAVINVAGGYANQNQEVGDNFVYFAMNLLPSMKIRIADVSFSQ